MSRLLDKNKLLKSLIECTKSGNKQIDNNQDIRILAVRNKKVAITILAKKLIIEKLLIVSTKMVLIKNKQDISIRKIWIQNIN